MKLGLQLALVFAIGGRLTFSTRAAAAEVVSASSPMPTVASAGGDSYSPIISPDGRYVLFASTANNLAMNGSNSNFAAFVPARINVFLRDRVNGTTTLVSVNSAGNAGGNGDSIPGGFSTNGTYVLFESSASDLVSGDTNNVSDVFLRDLAHGTTRLVSAGTNGSCGNGPSGAPVMTPDAHYVAFSSVANNLVAGDTNGIQDIFVKDMQTGLTTLASLGATKALSGFVWQTGSDSPEITPDGHYVVFLSAATNLVPGVQTTGEIYVRDLIAGATIVVSTNTAQVPVNPGILRFSCNPAISEDGRFIGFETTSSQMSGRGYIFQYDLITGVTELVHSNAVAPVTGYRTFRNLDMTADGRFMAFTGRPGGAVQSTNIWTYLWDSESSSTTLASVDGQGAAPTNAVCIFPAIDSSGRFVAFLSTATNLTTNAGSSGFHLYVRDLQKAETTLIDASTNRSSLAKDFLSRPQLSTNGQLVTFDCTDTDLVPGDNNAAYDVFVHDLVSATNDLISARIEALPTATAVGASSGPTVSVSADGRYIAFASNARNLVSDYTNIYRGIFVRDLSAETNILVSADTNGLAGADGMSAEPVISANARYVVFTSSADNLITGDTNGAQDVYWRDLQSGTTSLVSVNTNGVGPGNGRSYSPRISADARYVLFRSRASNLAAGSSAAVHENLLWRDMQAAATRNITANGASDFAMTSDGRFVGFGGTNGNVYVWDSQWPGVVYTNNTPTVSSVAISADGNRVAAEAASQIFVSDRAAQTNWMIASPGPNGIIGHGTLQFSSDARFLVYSTRAAQGSSDTNSVADVCLYDFQTGSNVLVSRSYLWSGAANGPSDSPCLSSDGRYVGYRSFASDIAPGATGGLANIYLYDRQTATTTLISASAFGNSAGNSSSFSPLFSADGQTFVFQSWSSDLVAHDFNQTGDVFALKLYSSNAPPIFSCEILFVPSGDPSPTISWPVASGKTYQLQFKNNLSDAVWQTAGGSITIIGNRAYAKDFSPNAGHRFYRVVAF